MNSKCETNKKIKAIMEAEDKKPSRIADKAGIRRDLFSRILAMRRPVYADELLPLCEALGVSVEELLKRPVSL